MANQTFVATELTRIQDATQISNTVTETILAPDYSFAANYFTQGKTIRVTAKGVCSNVITTPGTLTYRVHLGPLTLSAVYASASNALILDTVARTNFPWHLEFTVVCRSAGTSGTAIVHGFVLQGNLLSTGWSASHMPQLIPATAVAAGTLDTTVANLLSVSAQFSVSTSPTNLTTQTYIVESLN